MEFLENIKKHGLCCSSGKFMHTSKNVNLVQLPYKAQWEHPCWGNLITGKSGMALAIVHDDCIDEKGNVTQPPIQVIEINDEGAIFYHNIEKLDKA